MLEMKQLSLQVVPCFCFSLVLLLALASVAAGILYTLLSSYSLFPSVYFSEIKIGIPWNFPFDAPNQQAYNI